MSELVIRMPKLSMTMDSGEVLSWHKREGDPVRSGESLCDVMTDKVDMEVESPFDGVLTRIVAPAGTTVPVGEPIAYVASEGEDLLDDVLSTQANRTATESLRDGRTDGADTNEDVVFGQANARKDGADTNTQGTPTATPPSRKGPRPALPKARRLAAELRIDLVEIPGTGPNGVITVEDVRRAAQSRLAAVADATRAKADDQAEKLPVDFFDSLATRRRALRRAVARRMSVSASIPQFTVYRVVAVDAVRQSRGSITWTALAAYAFARALRLHPELRCQWVDGDLKELETIDIAIAVDTPIGLLAPVVRGADTLAPAQLDLVLRRVVDAARMGRLLPQDLDGAVATISNLGTHGIDLFNALLTPPQACALAVGAIRTAFASDAEGARARAVCTMSLTVDHRVADGADAARLMADISEIFAIPVDAWPPPIAPDVRTSGTQR